MRFQRHLEFIKRSYSHCDKIKYENSFFSRKNQWVSKEWLRLFKVKVHGNPIEFFYVIDYNSLIEEKSICFRPSNLVSYENEYLRGFLLTHDQIFSWYYCDVLFILTFLKSNYFIHFSRHWFKHIYWNWAFQLIWVSVVKS